MSRDIDIGLADTIMGIFGFGRVIIPADCAFAAAIELFGNGDGTFDRSIQHPHDFKFMWE